MGLLRTAAARFPGGGCSCPGLPALLGGAARKNRVQLFPSSLIHISRGDAPWRKNRAGRGFWKRRQSCSICLRTPWPDCQGGAGGDRELRIENHRGILAYGTEEIHVSGGAFVIQITGQGLELRAMTGLELLITGRIAGIQLA